LAPFGTAKIDVCFGFTNILIKFFSNSFPEIGIPLIIFYLLSEYINLYPIHLRRNAFLLYFVGMQAY